MSGIKMKWDLIFIGGVLFAALLIWGIFFCMNNGSGDMVILYQDGVELARYPLSEDELHMITYEEEYNLLMISDGKAFVSDAD
jgi:hypothetical protein